MTAVRAVLLPLVAFSVLACRPTLRPPRLAPPTGEPLYEARERLYPDGRPRRRWVVLVHADGLVEQHGRDLAWYPDGTLESERRFAHGAATGTWRSYFRSGARRSVLVHGDGVRSAPIRWWHENGALAAEGEGIAGIKQGPWTYWHPDGKVARAGAYVDGLRDGPWTLWDEDGRKTAEGAYDRGERVGTWTLWDESGVARTRRAVTRELPERAQGGAQ